MNKLCIEFGEIYLKTQYVLRKFGSFRNFWSANDLSWKAET